VFERFTERARQVVVLAQDEARKLRHNYIGTEHILLGLLREEEGLAARVLESLDITVGEARAEGARIVGPGDELTTGQIPFTPRAKKVLELSLREALALGHNWIGTEHVLLGLVGMNDGVAARVLLDFGADADKIRGEVIRMLSGPGRRQELPDDDPKSPLLTPEVAAELERLRAEPVWEGRPDAEEQPGYTVSQYTSAAPMWFGGARLPLVAISVGWVLFGAALGLGVLVGWLIWG
jgi:ATP-dependent Clp protease ATP-binding subunit ClpC